MLQRGDLVPHFEVSETDGAPVRYRTLWQRRNLVLVCLPADGSTGDASYVAHLKAGLSQLAAHEADLVMTREPVAGLPAPALLVADRWGEIVHVATAGDVAALPDANEIADWLQYVQMRCPECEGEAR